jgi:hypothetical protein
MVSPSDKGLIARELRRIIKTKDKNN